MTKQRTTLLTVAMIIVSTAMQTASANAQGSAPTHKHHPDLVQPIVEAVNKASQQAEVTPVASKVLEDFPGKEVVIITVRYPPGRSGAIHRHNAHAFIYVLQGSVVMGLNRGEPVTLGPGQTFYEGPNDIHTIGRNASKTRPAKFLVFLIKDKAAPISVPVK